MRLALEQLLLALPSQTRLTIMPTVSDSGIMLNASSVADFGGWNRIRSLLLPETLLASHRMTDFSSTFAAVARQVDYFDAPVVLILTATSPASSSFASSSLAATVSRRHIPVFVVGYASGLQENHFTHLDKHGGGVFAVRERRSEPLATAVALASAMHHALNAATGANLQLVASMEFDSPISELRPVSGRFDLSSDLTDEVRPDFHVLFMVRENMEKWQSNF